MVKKSDQMATFENKSDQKNKGVCLFRDTPKYLLIDVFNGPRNPHPRVIIYGVIVTIDMV